MQEDDQIIDATLAGDTAAFGELVRKYQDRLFNTLVHVVGCADEAQDVAQETFILAFRKLGKFQRKSSLYTWLYRIAMNTWISSKRKKRPQYSVDVAQAAGQEPVDLSQSPEEHMEQGERVGQIRAAIDELNDEHRGVLVLRDIEGCGYDQISQILEIPVGTVRSRLHRARMHLKMRLSQVLQENT